MGYDLNVLRRATARLEENHKKNAEQKQLCRRKAYAQQPRLSQLDRAMRGTMAELIGATLRKGEDTASAVQEIRERNLALQREREELLARMGLKAEDLDDTPVCAVCGDTGWRGTVMCQCLKHFCAQ